MKSSNPVLGRITAAAQRPTYMVPGGPAGTDYQQSYPGVQPSPVQAQRGLDTMSVDDVVVKTVTLIGLATLFAAITWAIVPVTALFPTWIAAMVVGLVLGLVISFAGITNPVIICGYAVVEGVFLGAVSKAFETAFAGIVPQAVIATFGVFGLMALLYKSKVIRATPKFMKIVIGAAAGLFVVMLVNLVWFLIAGEASPLRNGGPLAIGFSLVCIVVAALMFVVSFKQIEDGVAAGLPRRYGWLGAFGLLVELVWMYLEFLRLLSYFED
ncbi:MAG TPA: Bax inhibitor-1/YccA family protein [Candidatus Limnocylindrales bacterium]